MKYDRVALGAMAAMISTSTVVSFLTQTQSQLHHNSIWNASPLSTSSSFQLFSSMTTDNEAPPCATPDNVIPESVTTQALRNAVLTDANGQLIKLGEKIGKGTFSIIV